MARWAARAGNLSKVKSNGPPARGHAARFKRGLDYSRRIVQAEKAADRETAARNKVRSKGMVP